MSETTNQPRCEPACGKPVYCPLPPLGCSWEEWRAFWTKHPSRSRYTMPLSREAALRRGATQ